MAIVKNEIGRMPYGFYTKKSRTINTILSCVAGFLTFIVLVVLYFMTKNYLLTALITFLFFLSCVLLIAFHSNLEHKAIQAFYKDLDFVKLESKLQSFLKENLHSQTRNVILLDFSNILLSYDKERALLMWRNTKEPPVNKFLYHAFEINFLLFEAKFEEAKSLIDVYKVRYPGKMYQYLTSILELSLTIYSTNEIIEDIEKKLIWNKNNRFDKICKYSTLMYYFYSRGMKDKAIHYAKMIKEENAGCTEIDKNIEKILREE